MNSNTVINRRTGFGRPFAIITAAVVLAGLVIWVFDPVGPAQGNPYLEDAGTGNFETPDVPDRDSNGL
ncbi:MAG: hypothetical protein MRY75_12170 [Marivita sp.]|uniref:hypothetical protein n=1 Tax=Marivita sp. TaxID=2003365 RepID=UPI0025C1771B|nr:hypothetical protein [Marivita sp.]MCI5111299.1 hypothetical protein [Marivita sp.]